MTNPSDQTSDPSPIRLGLGYVEASIAAFMLTVMVGCTVLQVVARFAFRTGLSWTDEVAMFSFIWAALMGAALVINTGGAHRIDAFVRLLPARLRRAVLALVYATILTALILLIVYGVKLLGVVHFQKSSILKVNMSLIYASLPVSAALMLAAMLLDWRVYLKDAAGVGRDG
ncbi:TRAP transporter small permease [Labrenzia sp. 011]|uniref:TRAP transporter small permease n=1 Tax=Labrenzia sp. 011 TaxID=2171494 RepID=UPI00140393CD|nr:TRAP transporter small permease [Labrenzia sp. 011]